ncbi:MAG: right-handed parallel beta-helix repeat-containing protein, partial [Planctomycetes bacterium]|nr:right-handed parallel beta-helix repeat-containing protein [Planctomycetota bacterium]
FQWRKNTVPIGGATASSLSINPVVVGDAGSYDCVVTNPCGSVTSTAATLTVFSGNPAVTTPPANLALCITESALFSVVATDAQTYQWRKDGTPISGADAASYAIPSVVLADAGQYDCVITNPCGSTTSPAATLLVTDVLYVNHAATGSGTGVSWADAITDLETALTKPCTGVQVWVATGTYRPDQGTGNPALSFTLPSGKEVYGGFTGTETLLSQRNPIANPTILSGDIGTLGVDTDNSLHVVDASGADSSGLLDGFTVRAGRAGGGSGGGILISGGSPRIATCTLEDNRGASGAAAFSSTGTPTFDRVTFRSNAATGSGGAFANGSGSPILRRCRFESNSALDGGAVSDSGSAVLASCTFLGNQATGVGGALRIHPGATTQIHGSVLSGNAAGSGGAASNSGSLALTTSTLSSNSATGSGGALRTAGTLTVSNTILWGNSDASGSGQSAQISVASGTVSVNFCDVQGWTGALGGSGNLGVDPQLAEPLGPDGLAGTADDDVRTRPFSPVNDAGSNLLLPLDVADLDGDSITAEPIPLDVADRARRVDAVTVADSGAGSAPFVDIGAHEFCDCEPLPYGTGTPGCNGPQTMRAFGSPTIGNAGFQLRSDRSPASTLGLGMATTFPDVAGSDPFTIGALLHVDLFFSPEIYTLDFFSDPAGLGIAPVPLPNVPALIGSVYHAQTLWAWGTCSLPPFGISTSGGLRFKILGP